MPHLRHEQIDLKSVELTDQTLKKIDIVLIVTNHSSYDYDAILASAPLIFDCRNATIGCKGRKRKVVTL